jgi:hypothetical protein
MLTDGRYTWRHDKVLSVLEKKAEKKLRGNQVCQLCQSWREEFERWSGRKWTIGHRQWLAAAGRSQGSYAVSTPISSYQPKTNYCNFQTINYGNFPCRGRRDRKVIPAEEEEVIDCQQQGRKLHIPVEVGFRRCGGSGHYGYLVQTDDNSLGVWAGKLLLCGFRGRETYMRTLESSTPVTSFVYEHSSMNIPNVLQKKHQNELKSRQLSNFGPGLDHQSWRTSGGFSGQRWTKQPIARKEDRPGDGTAMNLHHQDVHRH